MLVSECRLHIFLLTVERYLLGGGNVQYLRKFYGEHDLVVSGDNALQAVLADEPEVAVLRRCVVAVLGCEVVEYLRALVDAEVKFAALGVNGLVGVVGIAEALGVIVV